MHDITKLPPAEEAIDRFAEDLARHPERADDIKRAFKRRMGLAPRDARRPSEAPEAEDLWDNVPV